MKQFNLLLTSLLLFIVVPLQAQISQGGTPIGKSQALSLESVPVTSLPTFNLAQVMSEDEQDEKAGNYPKIGRVRALSMSPSSHGEWTEQEDGGRLWRGAIKSRDAQGLSVQFENFALPEGAKMFIYSPDFEHTIGAFTEFNNHESGIFSTEIIPSDEVLVEYYEPTPSSVNPFTISGVVHCYRMVYGVESATREFGDSEACQVNTNCTEGSTWQDQKRGVARIFVIEGQFAGWCTGSLVNNTSEDCTPYFLTALHCGLNSTVTNMNQWVFHFNYESAGCTNGTEGQIATNTMTGCARIADSGDGGGNNGSDYLLVEINNEVPENYNPYFNGWRSTTTNSSSGVSIHHPSGDIKKISTYTGNLGTATWGGPSGTHWVVQWSATANGHGVTEGGSSGSPIFDSNGLIIGTLTGGSSFCSTPNDPDLYGKMSYHWSSNPGDNLSDFLDPISSGATSLTGTDAPCATGGGDNNDACADAVTVSPGIHAFSTVDATTDGPDQPGSACDSFGESNVAKDVWYAYTASCDGLASLSTCGTANFDTRIAIYPGGQCPPTAGSLIICNDDFGGCADFSSFAEWEVTQGSTYLLRIGGYSEVDFGTGTFELTEECGQTGGDCVADIPYPMDDPCVVAVIDGDSFCCDNTWDEFCQDAYDLCESGVDCAAGDISAPLQQDICPDETGTFNVISALIPAAGGYGVSFTPDGGTGGVDGGFSITGIAAFPFEFDADMNGLLSDGGYPLLSGQWTATGFVYSNPEDVGGTVCDVTVESITLNFLSADDAACTGTSGCAAVIPYPEDDPCVLVVITDDAFCCDTEWDEFCQEAYDACDSGFVCEAGTVTVPLEQDICPGEMGIFDADGVVIPDGGGYAVQFVPDGGTGGPGAGFSLTGVQPLPYEFDADLNGVLSGVPLPPLEGTWVLTGFTYTNPDSAAATFCSVANVDVVVNFLLEGDPACIGGGDNNDDCADAILVTPGVHSFSTVDAITDGPDQPGSECDAFEQSNVNNDVWYEYTASCDGLASFSTCGTADFDTRIAVYPGGQCPPTAASLIICNDDFGDCLDFSSYLEWDISEGTTYLLRIGGFSDTDFGTGTFELIEDCDFEPTDWCSDWVSPSPTTGWSDFNTEFGGAPIPDGNGDCAFNEITGFEVWMSEAYAMDGILAGVSYTFSHCNGPGAGSWVPEYTIITPGGVVDAYGAGDGDGCSITWVASESGTYLIVINEAGNCGVGAQVDNGFPAITCSDEITSVDEQAGSAFTLFPNPNSGQFSIQYVGEAGVAQVEVLEVSGKIVKSTQFTFNSDTYLPIDLGHQANGMYFVRITMNDNVIVQKVTVH